MSWVKEIEVFWCPGSSFCTTPWSPTGVASFGLLSRECSCNCSQQGPVKFPLLTKAILLSHCPSLLGSQQTALLCPIISHQNTAHIQYLAFSPPWSISVDPIQSESLFVYWTWCWSQGKTGRTSLWARLGHGPCSPRKSSYSRSDCIYYFLIDWPFYGWILRSKWYYGWSSHIRGNSVGSREPS